MKTIPELKEYQQTVRAMIICSGEIIRFTVFRTSLAFEGPRLLPGTVSLSLIERTITDKDFPPLFPFRNASQWMVQHASAALCAVKATLRTIDTF
jgi:hypothetical protein